MENDDEKPKCLASRRRMRTHAEWKVDTVISRARPPTSAATRSRISAAALLVKVIARIEPGCALRAEIVQAIRRVSTRVLPDPAPATTSSGRPSCTTAARWDSLSPSSSVSGSGRRLRGASSTAGTGNGALMSCPAYGGSRTRVAGSGCQWTTARCAGADSAPGEAHPDIDEQENHHD